MIARAPLLRVLASIVRHRLPADHPVPSLSDDTPLGPSGFELDSIALVDAAAAVNRFFHLHEAGVEDYLLRRRTLGAWADLVEAAQTAGGASFTFATSGSTGAPKHCPHAAATLAQEVEVLSALFSDRRRIVACVPSHHLYGFLFTVLLPEALGVPVVDAAFGMPEGHAPAPGDLIVAHPLRWRFLAASAASLPPDVAGVTSTAPCPAPLIESLLRDGLAGMTEVYGASETGGVGYRRDPAHAYRLLPYWRPLDGAAGRLVRTLPDGTDAAPVELMDRLSWTPDGRFRIEGRIDGARQVGGVNVFPERVADVLRAHPGVAEAAVRLMRPDEGERLKAFVVPHATGPTGTDRSLSDGLRRWTAERLSAAERPATITIGTVLPVSALGKPIDW